MVLTVTGIAQALDLATTHDLIVGWLEDGWLEITEPSRRASDNYRRFIGSLLAIYRRSK